MKIVKVTKPKSASESYEVYFSTDLGLDLEGVFDSLQEIASYFDVNINVIRAVFRADFSRVPKQLENMLIKQIGNIETEQESIAKLAQSNLN